MVSPCMGCKKRNSKCHADCIEYKNFVAQNEIIKNKRKEDSKTKIAIHDIKRYKVRKRH